MPLSESEVKELQGAMKASFESPSGQIVMEFLEKTCCWYQSVFEPMSRDATLINAGRREVLATIKTFLKYPPETIKAIIDRSEE